MDSKKPIYYILTVTCPAKSGIVAAISLYLFEKGGYISEMKQYDDELTQRFFCRIEFYLTKHQTTINSLKNAFFDIAKSFDMEWAITNRQTPTEVLIMVSKEDHCLNDLLYRQHKGELAMNITAVVSNHRDLRLIVEREGIPFVYLPIDKNNKHSQETKLLELIKNTGTELIILARYMQILSSELCQELQGKCINIHHSFLPGFKGTRPYHQAYSRGVKLIGATAHYVTDNLDEGPIIEQVVERVNHTQLPKALAALGRDMESITLAKAVRYHLERRVFIDNTKTVIFQ